MATNKQVVKELTPAERAALFDRWAGKVVRRNGVRACWGWAGAKSQKRNGLRGVIRVGGSDGRIMNAARVGVYLATGEKFADPVLARMELEHYKPGQQAQVDGDCVNPAHWRLAKATARVKAKGKSTSERTRNHAKSKR